MSTFNNLFEWNSDIGALPKATLGDTIDHTLKYQYYFLTALENDRLRMFKQSSGTGY